MRQAFWLAALIVCFRMTGLAGDDGFARFVYRASRDQNAGHVAHKAHCRNAVGFIAADNRSLADSCSATELLISFTRLGRTG